MSDNTDTDATPDPDREASDAGEEEASTNGAKQDPDEPASEPSADEPSDQPEDRWGGEGETSETTLGSDVQVDGESELEGDEENLLGGLEIDSTADIEVPDRLVDQVIGQDHARDVIKKAAKQRRHVMMIGSPGTGKSMLAKAMSQLLPREELQDVLVYHNPDDGNEPKVRTVPGGKGEQIVEA
ncbi:MAG: ATP-binding protein, partial [Haloarculaceae archaeon]